VDETTIKNLIEQSLRLRLTQKRDALAHARYSMSYEDVFRSGKENLPEAQFVRFITDASLIQLEAEFIIAGFYNNDDFMFCTKRTGEATSPTYFACAGEGSYLAHAALMSRSYMNVIGLGEALYLVYEAKKAAEAVNSVGKNSLISVLDEDGTRTTLNQSEFPHFFANLYGQYGPRPVPQVIDIPDTLFRND
jgi:20S proteasome alpha/beta subunit